MIFSVPGGKGAAGLDVFTTTIVRALNEARTGLDKENIMTGLKMRSTLAGAVMLAAAVLPAHSFACEDCGCEAAAAGKTETEAATMPVAAHSHDGSAPHTHDVHADASTATAPEADRKAILAMAGEYKVTFQFQETVAVEPGYELKDPYHAEATEFIEVIKDTGNQISLQHILVVNGDEGEQHVVKHWRQDWTYEDTTLNVFRGRRSWETIQLDPAEVAGTWTQQVYQVDDSPRYESFGKWTHIGERSSWESQETWRPLPRREFSKRNDYEVLVARNRHTITPDGWVHEQDNYKLVLDDDNQPEKVLAHESGLNVYDREDGLDFAAGREYWEDTKAYWSDVRTVWQDVLGKPGVVTFKAKVDGERMHEAVFAMADEAREGKAPAVDTIRQRIEAYIVK